MTMLPQKWPESIFIFNAAAASEFSASVQVNVYQSKLGLPLDNSPC
jgi:hypothetical protein